MRLTESNMPETYIKTYQYDNGEIQRVQVVTEDSFDKLQFLKPEGSKKSFDKIVDLYRNFIVPKCPWVFGKMILFYAPESFSPEDIAFLRKSVKVKGESLVYKTEEAKDICEKLQSSGLLYVVCGKLPQTKLLPVGNCLGFLSENMTGAKVKANSNFFIMDCFDVGSVFDRIGTPLGLMCKDGKVLNPPQFDREALLVYKDDSEEVRKLSLNELTFVMGNNRFSGKEVEICERPKTCRVGKIRKGRFAVIVGCRVEGVFEGGGFDVPSSGFALKIPKNALVKVGDSVEYEGLENVKFGLQVGNSIVVNGEKTTGFISKFYSIYKHLGRRAYPPSLYPLDYEKARAPRVALGATGDGKPCLLWAEGPKKTGYVPGEQSCGASLSEMADIAADLGLYNAVNLDGGGSAQILIDNKRNLIVSDRNPADDSDAERAVPAGIYIN